MTSVTGWLLCGALLLPIVGAVIVRMASQWLDQRMARLVTATAFGVAITCLLALQWMPVDAATAGRLAIFLPSRAVIVPQESLVELPTAPPTAQVEPTTQQPTATVTATSAATPTPTIEPTPTPVPTDVPPPPTEAPPPPTEAPPTAAPAGPQRYIVESGDTLRSIASRFDVSVEALLRYNGLSEEEGDSLSVGQELFIPPQ